MTEEIAEKISKKTKTEIWSVFKTEICDKVCADIGPLEFVNLIFTIIISMRIFKYRDRINN